MRFINLVWIILPPYLRKKIQLIRWKFFSRGWIAQNSGSVNQNIHLNKYRRLFHQSIQDNHIDVVLDYGCGDGLFLDQIGGSTMRLIGVDIDRELIKRNRTKYRSIDFFSSVKDIPRELLKDKNIVVNFSSTIAYLEEAEVIQIVKNLTQFTEKKIFVSVTDTCKQVIPKSRSYRGRLAYNYNLSYVADFLDLKCVKNKISKEIRGDYDWYFQELWGEKDV